MKTIKLTIIALFFAFATNIAWAQKGVIIYGDSVLTANDIPPLSTLIQAAIENSPMRGYQEARKTEAESMVKTAKREILNYMGAEGYYRYGRLGLVDENSPQGSGANTPLPITTSSTQSQNWWYVGAYVRIPIFAITNRANQVKRMKATIDQAEYLKEDAAQQISILVVEEYNKLLLNLDLLAIKLPLLQTNEAQIHESENEYRNGRINLGRLAQLQEMQVKVATEYATVLSECRTSLVKLERLTGLSLRINPNVK